MSGKTKILLGLLFLAVIIAGPFAGVFMDKQKPQPAIPEIELATNAVTKTLATYVTREGVVQTDTQQQTPVTLQTFALLLAALSADAQKFDVIWQKTKPLLPSAHASDIARVTQAFDVLRMRTHQSTYQNDVDTLTAHAQHVNLANPFNLQNDPSETSHVIPHIRGENFYGTAAQWGVIHLATTCGAAEKQTGIAAWKFLRTSQESRKARTLRLDGTVDDATPAVSALAASSVAAHLAGEALQRRTMLDAASTLEQKSANFLDAAQIAVARAATATTWFCAAQ